MENLIVFILILFALIMCFISFENAKSRVFKVLYLIDIVVNMLILLIFCTAVAFSSMIG